MNKSNLLILTLFCAFCVACNTDEPSSPSDNEQHQNGGDSNSNNNTSNPNSNTSEDKYYFELDRPASREIKTEAGSTQIFFKCNQEYTISASGNITGLKLSHTFGKGNGSVTVSFDEVQYKASGSNIIWDENGYIIFTVKEGNKSNFSIVRKEFYLVRRGSKMKV